MTWIFLLITAAMGVWIGTCMASHKRSRLKSDAEIAELKKKIAELSPAPDPPQPREMRVYVKDREQPFVVDADTWQWHFDDSVHLKCHGQNVAIFSRVEHVVASPCP